MMKVKEFDYNDIVMSDKEMSDVINDHVSKMNAEEIVDMIIKIAQECKNEEPEAFKHAIPLAKLTYIGRELYKYGFMMALYLMNESIKQAFEE